MTIPSAAREIDKTRVLLRVLQGGATDKRVAPDLGMTPEYVRGLADELEAEGLIFKGPLAHKAQGQTAEEVINMERTEANGRG